jgi:hypothetical protein
MGKNLPKQKAWLKLRLLGITVEVVGRRLHLSMREIRFKPSLRIELGHLAPSTQTLAATNALLFAGTHLALAPTWLILSAVTGGALIGAKSLKPPTVATCVGAGVGLGHAIVTMNWVSIGVLAPIAIVATIRDTHALVRSKRDDARCGNDDDDERDCERVD